MIYKKLRDLIFLLMDFIYSKIKIKKPFDRGTVQNLSKILIIQLQQLGDSMVFTPTLRAIRKRYPNTRIDLLVNSISYEIYSKSHYINNFWILKGNHKVSWEMFKLLRRIRKQNYDCSVLCITQRAFRYNLISYLTKTKERIGFNWRNRSFLNTISIPFDESKSYIDLNLKIAVVLDAKPQGRDMEVWYNDEDRRYIDGLLNNHKVTKDRIFISIHPGSNWQSKRWFPERFAQVADFLVSDYNAQVIFSGTEKDREVVDAIRTKMSQPSISLIGKTNIRQLAALIERCKLFVSVDSGPQHIAQAVGTPMVLLMSTIDLPYRWRPLDEIHQVLFHCVSCGPCFKSFCHTKECMNLITIDEVTVAIERQIRHIKNSRVTLNEKGNESWKKNRVKN